MQMNMKVICEMLCGDIFKVAKDLIWGEKTYIKRTEVQADRQTIVK